MTDWSQLKHAYGTAEDIPGLMERVEPDPLSRTWTELSSRLCHQGMVYSASFAALPALAQKARDWSPADRATPLILAGAIVSRAHKPIDVHREYETQIAEMIGLTSEALHEPDVMEADYIYLLQALAAFEAIEVWDQYLDCLVDGRFEAFCPECEAENTVVVSEEGYFVEGDPDEDLSPKPLQPTSADGLDDAARRLHAQALADGRLRIAEKLTYLFGTAECAYCETIFRLSTALADG